MNEYMNDVLELLVVQAQLAALTAMNVQGINTRMALLCSAPEDTAENDATMRVAEETHRLIMAAMQRVTAIRSRLEGNTCAD